MFYRKLQQIIEAWVVRYTRAAFRHPLLFVLGFVIAGAAAALFAWRTLRVETDLKALLPEGTASVAALDESRERIGSTDFFVIAIRSASKDRAAIAAAQDALKVWIEAEWNDAVWVQTARDTTFFKDHALYYFSEEKLRALKSILADEVVKASAKSLPGMVSFLDDDGQAHGNPLSAWLDETTLRELGLPPQIERELAQTLHPKTGDDADGEGSGGRALGDRLIGPKNDVGVVLVQLSRPSTDLAYARFALGRGEALADAVIESFGTGDLDAQVVGAYRSFLEVDAVKDDGRVATGVSVALVILVLVVFFRSFRAPIGLFLPLAITGAVTMALTAVIFGRLTVLTLFVLAMLAGMGIDYAIHLFGRVKAEVGGGRAVEGAVAKTLLDTGVAVLTAGLTTIGAIATLLIGHFTGFHEFAVVASLGIALSVVITLLMTPPIIALLNRWRPIFVAMPASRTLPSTHSRQRFERWVTAAFIGGVAVTLVLAMFAKDVQFENDFRKLRGPKTGATIKYGRAIGKNASTTPAIILGTSREEMSRVHGYLKARVGDPVLSSFITASTLVPPTEDQRARRAVIEEIGALAGKRAMKRLKGEEAHLVRMLEKMAAASPFDEQALPDWARMMLSEQDGRFGNIGHLYANVKDWDAASVARFQEAFGVIRIDGRAVPVANSAFVLSDIVTMVKADGARLLIVTLVLLFGILVVFSRSVKGAAILFAGVIAGLIWTAGIMGLAGIRIGLYNLIVIPVILGVGIDTAIHLYHRHRALGRNGLKENLRQTGAMVAASALTTVAGFAGLLFVSHMGLWSIGVLAGVGISASLLSMLIVLPYLLMTFCDRKGTKSVGEIVSCVIPSSNHQGLITERADN